MTNHFNGLSPAEDERLAILIEECSEVIKAAAKIQRHGYNSFNPDDVDSGDNRLQLAKELGDLTAIVNKMIEIRDVDKMALYSQSVTRNENGDRYTHHQPGSPKDPGSGYETPDAGYRSLD